MGSGQESRSTLARDDSTLPQATPAGSGEVGGLPACDWRKDQRRRNQSWGRRAEDRRLCPGRRLLNWTSSQEVALPEGFEPSYQP